MNKIYGGAHCYAFLLLALASRLNQDSAWVGRGGRVEVILWDENTIIKTIPQCVFC